MAPEYLDLTKFLSGCVTVLAGVWGTAKIIAPIKHGDGAKGVDHERFRQGEKRMDAFDRKFEQHDERFQLMQRENVALRLELGELKPHFVIMKESIGSLKDGMSRVDENLTDILNRLPDS